jgi:hypothetical protein
MIIVFGRKKNVPNRFYTSSIIVENEKYAKNILKRCIQNTLKVHKEGWYEQGADIQ